MKLYLMRHAHAEEGDRTDPYRGLTDIGELQCEVMRKFMKLANLKPDIIITSEFQRAFQTAENVQRGEAEIVQTPALNAPEHAVDVDTDAAWAAVLKLAGDAKDVLVITHGPLIEKFLSAVAFGLDDFHFEHGALCYVNTAESRFRWFVTPKLAAHLIGEEPKDVENTPAPLEAKESFRTPAVKTAVAPLVAQVRKGLRIRWRAQLKQLEVNGLPLLEDALATNTYHTVPSGLKAQVLATLPMRMKGFAVKYRKATRAAYNIGADRVASQLPTRVSAVQEATPPKKLPGPTREPEELEDELDATTTDRTGSLIDKAFEDGLAYSALIVGARELFGKFDDSRGEATAGHEISTAYHDGGRDQAATYAGELEKQWETGGEACEDCQANEDMGPIPADAPFDSGDFEPPAHPNCDCGISYQAADEEE